MPPKAKATADRKPRTAAQRRAAAAVAELAAAEQRAAVAAVALAKEQAAKQQRLAAEREAVQKVFHAADVSKDGFLYCDDLQAILDKLGMKGSDSLLKEMDSNQDGRVSLDEFLTWIFSDRGEEVKAGLEYEHRLREMLGDSWDALRNDAEALRQKADTLLEQGQETLEAAVLQLEIEKSTFAELRVIGRPPPSVISVVEALMCLLKGTSQPVGWPACQEFLANGHIVSNQIHDLEMSVTSDDCAVCPAGVAAAREMLQQPGMSPNAIRSFSNAASRFCIWIQGMVGYYNVRQQVKVLHWAAASAGSSC